MRFGVFHTCWLADGVSTLKRRECLGEASFYDALQISQKITCGAREFLKRSSYPKPGQFSKNCPGFGYGSEISTKESQARRHGAIF